MSIIERTARALAESAVKELDQDPAIIPYLTERNLPRARYLADSGLLRTELRDSTSTLCAWCDNIARGTAVSQAEDRRHPSCGVSGHGLTLTYIPATYSAIRIADLEAKLAKVRAYAEDRAFHARGHLNTVNSGRIASDLFAILDTVSESE